MFVGDVNNGNLYHFKLNDNRTELILDGFLDDRVVKGSDEIPEQMVFGRQFGAITDIEIGPDGYMYILTHDESEGAIYRVTHSDNN